MAETSIEDLKTGLRQIIERPPKNWGHFSLARSRQFKDATERAQRLLKQAKPAAASLRNVTAEVKSFYD